MLVVVVVMVGMGRFALKSTSSLPLYRDITGIKGKGGYSERTIVQKQAKKVDVEAMGLLRSGSEKMPPR